MTTLDNLIQKLREYGYTEDKGDFILAIEKENKFWFIAKTEIDDEFYVSLFCEFSEDNWDYFDGAKIEGSLEVCVKWLNKNV